MSSLTVAEAQKYRNISRLSTFTVGFTSLRPFDIIIKWFSGSTCLVIKTNAQINGNFNMCISALKQLVLVVQGAEQ